MRIRALLFDAGDVLYHRPRRWERTWDYLSQLGLPQVALDDPAWLALKTRAHLGLITEGEYMDGLMDLFGVQEPLARVHAREIIYTDERDIEFFEGVEQTLHRLREMGLQLAVVTDTQISTEEKLHWFRKIGIDDVWDSFATSCELNAIKPDKRLYLAALEPLGVQPSEAAFVGHAEDEMQGARALGMITIAFNRDHEQVPADYVICQFTELMHVVRDIG